MAQVLITESYLEDIADAIREKNGSQSTYKPGQMAMAISALPDPPTLISKSIIQNGLYNPSSDNADGYNNITVSVSNSYTIEDEGKIVQNGALVSHVLISKTISENGEYNPANDNADAYSNVVVNIAGGFDIGDEGKVVQNGALISQGSMSISINSSYDTTAFSNVVVDVPNSYSAADEGKVVASGLLSEQGIFSIISNSIYDTTFFSQVSVAIPEPVLASKYIIENGTYDPTDDNADAYSQVVVSVPNSGSGDDNRYLILCERSSGILVDSELIKIKSYWCQSNSHIYGIQAINVDEVKLYAFDSCSLLSYVSLPKCSLIGGSAFVRTNIQDLYLPSCKSIGGTAFAYCSSLQNVSLPIVTYIGAYAFNSCSLLQNVSIPECISISNYCFSWCKNLAYLSLPKCKTIGSYAFCSCAKLESLYLLQSSVATLGTYAFTSTPMSISTFLGYFGSIYVPASLVDAYKSANRWSVYSDRITAYVEE